jgi:hypothetical protein
MPKNKTARKKAAQEEAKQIAYGEEAKPGLRNYCSMPVVKPREFDAGVHTARLELIVMSDKKWVNGTVLHYYFFDAPASWAGSNAQRDVVRRAFQTWKDLGVGLEFKEVTSRDEAEIRIGFLRGDGAWSYVGRDVLSIGRDERTMNFGWDIAAHPREFDTALHEIGHTLGFPHEHQNPNAGIVWDEDAVYRALGGAPNFWPRETTFHNIIRKISPDTVQGSSWDPDSVMHYPFEPGMILEPPQFAVGLNPAGGLSARDKQWVKTFYPLLTKKDYEELVPFRSAPLQLAAGQQANFLFKPTATRRYNIATFGASDTVMALFEREPGGDPRYLAADDDSGLDTNARLCLRLLRGREYIIRIRLYWADREGDTAVMVW